MKERPSHKAVRSLVRDLLNEPLLEERQIDGSVVMVGGEPKDVIVRFRGSKVSILMYTARWEGPDNLVVYGKHFATISCNRFSEGELYLLLHGLIQDVRETRKLTFRRCERCNSENPPEFMHDDKICQSCAQHHLGVIY